jgi:hypothetical protein
MAEIFDRASTIMAEEGVAGRSRPNWVSAAPVGPGLCGRDGPVRYTGL